MKLSAIIFGLLAAMGIFLSASAPTAMPFSAPPFAQWAAATPVAVVQHRLSSTRYHYGFATPTRRDREACDPTDASQLYDWGRYGISHNPCWPCVSGEESATSAYPSWEVRPYCED